MSFIPDNFINQLSDLEGNIKHQGILASNISKSSTLSSTFPTTSTGDSLGHYHYTATDGSNRLKFLNCSGSGVGGHYFYTSNSTTAPIETARLDINGFSIIKNNITTLYNTIGTFASGPTFIILALNPMNPPYNWVLGQMYIVRVGNTTATMSTGVDYNVQYIDTQAIRVRTTSSPTSPVIDSTGITSVLLPYSTSGTIDTSVLSSNNLTFNGVSAIMNQVQPTLIYSSAVIYADGQPPATSLLIRNNYGYSGWYMKNVTPLLKINWYFPPNKLNATLVSDLKGVSISFFNGVTTSNDDTLFITILTVPTGSGDFAPGFFHSSNTYVFNQSITPIANTNYQGVCIIDKSLVPFNYETQIQYEQSTINNPRGTYAPTDKILAVVIGSNSASATNSVEFVVNKLNLHYANFTQSYLLVPP